MNFLQPPYQFMEFRAKRGSGAQERQRRSQPFQRRLDLLNQQYLAIPHSCPSARLSSRKFNVEEAAGCGLSYFQMFSQNPLTRESIPQESRFDCWNAIGAKF